MCRKRASNHPIVIWGAFFLVIISLFSLTISPLLTCINGGLLTATGTEDINAILLLSGLMLLPPYIYMIYSISMNIPISPESRVLCCSLKTNIIWIIILNFCGCALCIRRIICCKLFIEKKLLHSMSRYRTALSHKRFVDNLQWTFNCCGLNSYKDWFTRDWYDKSRDYEWDPSSPAKRTPEVVDSVPLSCCKSGSCISNYLGELGTYSINTRGCARSLHQLVLSSMLVNLIIFLTIIIVNVVILCCICKKSQESDSRCGSCEDYNVQEIMDIKKNFRHSSESYQCAADSDDEFNNSY